MIRKKTRIDVRSFHGGVCPRFDLMPEILIFDISTSEDEHTEKIEVQSTPPEKIINMLARRQVSVLVSGENL